jgi:hypothetical protein
MSGSILAGFKSLSTGNIGNLWKEVDVKVNAVLLPSVQPNS